MVQADKALETRRRIIREATTLFARRGYHRTTVTDIANAIGMTQGAFFHHFPNKEALLEAVVKRLAKGFSVYREAVAGEEAGAMERVMKTMVDHYEAQPEATICLAALATEFAGSGHPILEEIKKAYEEFVGPFSELLKRTGSIADPRAAAISFIGAVQGVAVQGLLREGSGITLRQLSVGFMSLVKR